jgi:phage I-like protein
MKTKTAPHIAALSLALSSDGGAGAGALQLMPAGRFDAPRGAIAGQGPWTLTAESAAKVIAKVARRINDMPIDYEHQTLLSAQNGKPAPAAGWIKPNSLHFDPAKGLLSTGFKWTDTAAAAIAADEYRYLSPVFSYDKNTGEVLDLINVALVNAPAIDGMDAVTVAAASFYSQPDEDPSVAVISKLKKNLGLADNATDEELTQAVAALKAKADASDSKDTEIAALKAQSPDPAKYAPVAALTAMQTELAALKAKDIERDVNDLITPALADGRLLPAQEQWARDLGKSNLAALKSFVDSAQPIPALAGMQTGGKAPGADPALSGDALVAACKTHWDSTPSTRSEFATLEDYTAYKKAEAAGQIRIHGAK